MLVKELAHRNLFLQHVGRDLEPLSSRNGNRVLDLRLGRWPQVIVHDEPRSPEQKRRAMSWAQRLKRVFSIDVTTCAHCGGAVRIVASIEDPKAIRAILAHFEKHGALEQAHYRPAARAPPPAA